MRRIVLDTNCLLQSLPSKSPYHKIWTEVMCGNICLCVNTEILDEYEDDDNKFTDCAVASGAEFIVTNDKHYNILKRTPWPNINVLHIKEFFKVLP